PAWARPRTSRWAPMSEREAGFAPAPGGRTPPALQLSYSRESAEERAKSVPPPLRSAPGDACRLSQLCLERDQLADAQPRQLLQLARQPGQVDIRLESAQLLQNRHQPKIDPVRLIRLGMTLLLESSEDRLRLIFRLRHGPNQLFARIGRHDRLFYHQIKRLAPPPGAGVQLADAFGPFHSPPAARCPCLGSVC